MEMIVGVIIVAVLIAVLIDLNSSKKRRTLTQAEARKRYPTLPQTAQKPTAPTAKDYGKATFKKKRDTILTARETECFKRLSQSLSPDFYVFPQVAFSQILEAHGGTREQNLWLFRTMSQKVADFVVCKQDMTIVAVIELDDRSHDDKKDADKARDQVIRQIGLLPLRLPRTPQQDKIDAYAAVLRRMYDEQSATA
ncbi:DUF2726 domain-containing protein [Neisseriaceae bacterium TC5R-5]|nr:DUF2726 domain-containing protein [Neisseriaceae bacterium TC5R-5]